MVMVMAKDEIEREAASKSEQADQQRTDAEASAGGLNWGHRNRLRRRRCSCRSGVQGRKHAASRRSLRSGSGSGGSADGGG